MRYRVIHCLDRAHRCLIHVHQPYRVHLDPQGRQMSHEPECHIAICICVELRAAYLRGIRDASVTVRYLVDKFEADTVQRGDK